MRKKGKDFNASAQALGAGEYEEKLAKAKRRTANFYVATMAGCLISGLSATTGIAAEYGHWMYTTDRENTIERFRDSFREVCTSDVQTDVYIAPAKFGARGTNDEISACMDERVVAHIDHSARRLSDIKQAHPRIAGYYLATFILALLWRNERRNVKKLEANGPTVS